MSVGAPAGPARVLITNAEQRSVLASCRSLAAAGYEVGAIAFARRAAAHRSRSCSERLRMTDPAWDAERFVAELAALLERERYDALIPGSDTALLAISQGRGRLEELTRIGLPSREAVERSLDREALSAAAAAAAAGLASPREIRCPDLAAARAAASELGYPVLVKSIRTALSSAEAIAQGTPSCLVSDERELAQVPGVEEEGCLVQGREHGEAHSFGGVMIEGRLIALSMARYLRTWPPRAGYAAFAQTIVPPRGLERAIEELLRTIGWQGLFELELIRTAPERFVPIDLNPRPYGSLALAVSAGAPLPAIWCRWLLDGRLPPGADTEPLRARAGYGYRWEDADLRNVVWRLRRGRLLDAARVALPRRHVTHAYFRLRDPLPLLVRLADIAGNRIGGEEEGPQTTPSQPSAVDAGETPAGV